MVGSGRVAKELNECAPAIQHAMDVTSAMPSVDADAVRRGEVVDDRATIVDLCSGFGYLGMFLSEMLDPSKVKAIELVDKQWPMWTAARPTASQINWDHIRGVEGVRASELGGDRRRDRGGKKKVRSIHWFPYDRVGVVNADP